MTKRLFLHVGLPKSGTSSLQAMLGENKMRLLADAKLLYPGRTWADQVDAVRDLRRMPVPKQHRKRVRGSWRGMVDEIAAWSGDSVISMEWLCAAKPEHVRQISTDVAPAQLEVIFTVRDLGRTLPAAWQEFIQNRQDWPWSAFLDAVTAPGSATLPAKAFWSQQDAERLVGTWSEILTPEQITVVTVPPPGTAPSVLWERFCVVLGIDVSGYRTGDLGGNESLGLESAEMMRRLNPLTRASGIDISTYNEIFKRGMAKNGLAQRKSAESRLGIPVEQHDWVRRRAAQQVEGIQSLGVDIVGDVRDLEPVLGDGECIQPNQLDLDRVLDAALDGIVVVAHQRQAEVERINSKAAQLAEQLDQQRRECEGLKGQWQWAWDHPVRAAISSLSRRHRVLGWARKLYSRVWR